MQKAPEKTTLYLRKMPDRVVREAKAAAARRGSTLTRFVAEALESALGTGSASVPERSGEGNLAEGMAWFDRNRSRLLTRYPGEFVAILRDRVLDHDADFDALARRIFDVSEGQAVYMPRLGEDKPVRKIRSPRLVRK